MEWKQASPYPHAHRRPQFPSTPSKTKPSPHPALGQPAERAHPHQINQETSRGEDHHGRRQHQRGRPQARRGGAAVRRLGQARAGRRPGQGPPVRAARPRRRLRRHRRLRVRQGQRLRRVPREEQAQQGAERQEEGGHQRRQLRPRLHRPVRQLQVPLQLHRLPGPRQAEESAVHHRRPRDRVRGEGEVQVRIQRLLEVVKL